MTYQVKGKFSTLDRYNSWRWFSASIKKTFLANRCFFSHFTVEFKQSFDEPVLTNKKYHYCVAIRRDQCSLHDIDMRHSSIDDLDW